MNKIQLFTLNSLSQNGTGKFLFHAMVFFSRYKLFAKKDFLKNASFESTMRYLDFIFA